MNSPTTPTLGPSAPGGHPRIFFNAGLPTGALGWGTVTTRPSLPTSATFFAAYNTTGATGNTNGIQLLDPAAQVAFASAGAADHALLTNSGSLVGAKTVNTLQINTNATGHSLNLGTNNLVIGSGGLLKTGDQDYAITGTGTLGQAGGELFVHIFQTTISAPAPILTVGVPIVANGLVKNGPGALNLTANNTYTGPTTLGFGTIRYFQPDFLRDRLGDRRDR